MIELHHFDFGCTDMDDPSATVRKELSGAIGQVLKETGLVTMIFRPNAVVDRLASALFDKGTYMPEVASIPLGLLAATGANERVTIDGKERPLLDDKGLARAFKAGLEGAKIPAELRVELPTGIKGWLLKRAFQRIDTKGARFV
jgi:hypothetical protein